VTASLGSFWLRTGFGLVGQGLNLVIGVAASIPLARGLGVTGKGEFAFYTWAVGLVVALLGWGWHGAVATVASENVAAGVNAARSSRRRLLPAVAVLLLVACLCLIRGATGWCFAGLSAIALLWGQPASGALAGSGRIKALYCGILTQSAIQLLILAALFLFATLTPELAMSVSAFGALCGTLVSSRLAGVGLFPGAEVSARLATLARNGWVADLATFLNYRLDIVFVRHFVGAEGLGLYTTATSVAELGRTVPNAIGQAALRDLGQASREERVHVARRTAFFGVAASLVMLTMLAAAAPWLVTRLYGSAFAPAAPLVAWLAPGIASLTIASVSASWLAISARSHVTARLAWYGCAASAIVSVTLIAGFGLTGAAAASSVGYALLASMTWRAATRPPPHTARHAVA